MSDDQVQHAFVSYVHEDTDAVDQLTLALQAASVPVWRDTEDLWPGEDWQIKIRQAIESGSLAFIACFSTNSVQKSTTYMNAELRLAVDQIRLMKPGQVWLLPVRLDNCELPHFDIGNNRTLDSLQRIDLFGPNRDANLARLTTAVKGILGTSAATPATAATAIASARDPDRGPLLAEALKAMIANPGKQMDLENLILDETRKTTKALRDEARFSVASAGPSPTAVSLAKRVQEYDALVEPLAYASVTLGAWGGVAHASLVTRMMKSLATTTQDARGGYSAHLRLRAYPLLPVLYAGAFGAVARSNGRMLSAFTTDPVITVDGKTSAVPVAITPWRPVAGAESSLGFASALAYTALRGGTIEEHAQAVQTRKEGRYHTPISEYMLARLRPLADPYVMDDAEYVEVFHRAEALIALAELDWMANNSDSVPDYRRAQPEWIGRSAHVSASAGLASDLLREIQTRQKAWWPIAGGMFGGDWKRAEAAAATFIQYETEARQRRW
jgi:hypothetical protein